MENRRSNLQKRTPENQRTMTRTRTQRYPDDVNQINTANRTRSNTENTANRMRSNAENSLKSAQSNAKNPKASKGKKYTNKRPARKRTSTFYKVVAIVFIAVIIVIGGLFIKSFGTGSRLAKKGLEAYDSGDYAMAIQYFSEAIEYDSRSMTYRMELGMAQIKNADYDDAIATFTEMKEKAYSDTDKQSALRGMGIAYMYKSNYAEAENAFSDAMAYAGKTYTDQEMDILYYLAEAQDKNGDPVAAVLTYTKILNQESSADVYLLRGAAYQKVGDNTNAEADLAKAIELSKQGYKAYMMLYQVLIDQDKTIEAQKLLEEAVTLSVKTSEDYSNRGIMYMNMKEYDLAMADFETAIASEYWPAYFNKACLLMNQGLMEEAVENFTIYFEHVTDNALAYNQYGVCMMNLADYQTAADAFNSGIALNDRTVDQELMYNVVVAYERMGKWEEAYTRVKAYTEKYPDDERMQKELVFIESRQ